jgi:hypothetical protein
MIFALAAWLLAAPVAAAPAAPVPAAPPAAAAAKPSLTPDKEGFCQQTEFIGWASDGSEAAYAESFCRQPPPDAAFDTLYRVGRDGKLHFWLIGDQSGATLATDTRARLLFGTSVRKAGPKAPAGPLSATAKIEGDYLLVTFTSSDKDVKAPAPVSRELALPYAKWPYVKAPSVGELFWSPDGGALAVTLKAVRKEPAGGKLPVAAVAFVELRPLPAPAPVAAPKP